MNGKTLKVVEYNLSFGANDRMVNIFGLFRYKPTNSLYVVYSDLDIKYNIIYYGSSHIKNNSILSMGCKEKQEEEIIKEYIFKVTTKENLDNFEMISLDQIEGLEIIASNKIEVKPEVLYQLVELTIPKPKIEDNQEIITPTKKKSSKKGLLFIVLTLLLLSGSYLYFSTLQPKDTTSKEIICTKTYQHDILNASIEEKIIYAFNYQDNLEKVNTTRKYQFNQENYQQFIQNGTFYRYMPDDDADGGWDKSDTEYWFKVITKENVDSSYNNPTNYEDVLLDAKKEGYACDEQIKKE